MNDPDKLDEAAFFSETPEQACKRILSDNAPFAATAIVELATDITVSSSVRLHAAKYVVDRALGPIGPAVKEDALEQFLVELQNEANKGEFGGHD